MFFVHPSKKFAARSLALAGAIRDWRVAVARIRRAMRRGLLSLASVRLDEEL